MARHVRKGDTVQVLSGKYRGKQGRVLEVLVEAQRVRVEGVAPVKRHLKPNKDPKLPKGGIIEKFGTVHISNVLPLDPKNGKPTRVGYAVVTESDGTQRKVRISKRSGEQIITAA